MTALVSLRPGVEIAPDWRTATDPGEARRATLGGSELPTVCGVEGAPGSPRGVWRSKVDPASAGTILDADWLALAEGCEAATRRRLEEEHGAALTTAPHLRLAGRPRSGTPDLVGRIGRARVVVEVKSGFARPELYGPGERDCSPHSVLQGADYGSLFVEADLVLVAAWVMEPLGGGAVRPRMRLYTFEVPELRDAAERASAYAEGWWARYVVPVQPPPDASPGEWATWGPGGGARRAATDREAELGGELAALRAARRDAEAAEAAVKARLAALTGRDRVEGPGWRAAPVEVAPSQCKHCSETVRRGHTRWDFTTTP